MRSFAGTLGASEPVDVDLHYLPSSRSIEFAAHNPGSRAASLAIRANAYWTGDEEQRLSVPAKERAKTRLSLAESGNWYDYTVSGDGFERRFAGRLETGGPGISDPAVGLVRAEALDGTASRD